MPCSCFPAASGEAWTSFDSTSILALSLGKLRAGPVQFLDFLLAEHTALPVQLGALDLAVQALKLLLVEISPFLRLFKRLFALAAEFLKLGFSGGNIVLPKLLKNGPRLGVQLLDFFLNWAVSWQPSAWMRRREAAIPPSPAAMSAP